MQSRLQTNKRNLKWWNGGVHVAVKDLFDIYIGTEKSIYILRSKHLQHGSKVYLIYLHQVVCWSASCAWPWCWVQWNTRRTSESDTQKQQIATIFQFKFLRNLKWRWWSVSKLAPAVKRSIETVQDLPGSPGFWRSPSDQEQTQT